MRCIPHGLVCSVYLVKVGKTGKNVVSSPLRCSRLVSYNIAYGASYKLPTVSTAYRTKYTSHRPTSYRRLHAALHTLHKLPRGVLHIVLVGSLNNLLMLSRLRSSALVLFLRISHTVHPTFQLHTYVQNTHHTGPQATNGCMPHCIHCTSYHAVRCISYWGRGAD